MFDYPIRSDRSKFSIQVVLDRLVLKIVIPFYFLLFGGVDWVYEFEGVVGLVRLDLSWFQVVGCFVEFGFWYIFDGIDYLFFLLCFVILFWCACTIISIVTVFIVVHSIILIVFVFNYVLDVFWFLLLIEMFIVLSTVYIVTGKQKTSNT